MRSDTMTMTDTQSPPDQKRKLPKNVSPWSKLREKTMAEPGAAEDAERHGRLINAEMRVGELRKARQITQVALAEMLGIEQASVSQQEHRDDHTVSTLRSYIEAIGGRLRISAVFEDEDDDIEILLHGSSPS